MVYRHTERGKQRAQLKKETIVLATQGLIGQTGFAQTTIRAVAEASGVAAGTIYRYFHSREELLAEVFRRVASREFAAVNHAVESTAGNTKEKLVAFLSTFAVRAFINPTLAEAMLFEPANPLVEQERLSFRMKYHDLMVEIIRDGVRTGLMCQQDVALSARAVIGATAEALMGKLTPSPHNPTNMTIREDTIESIISFCLRALGVSVAS